MELGLFGNFLKIRSGALAVFHRVSTPVQEFDSPPRRDSQNGP
jgi:hypothetical protein